MLSKNRCPQQFSGFCVGGEVPVFDLRASRGDVGGHTEEAVVGVRVPRVVAAPELDHELELVPDTLGLASEARDAIHLADFEVFPSTTVMLTSGAMVGSVAVRVSVSCVRSDSSVSDWVSETVSVTVSVPLFV